MSLDRRIRAALHILGRLRENLSRPGASARDPVLMEYLCGELAYVGRHLHAYFLERGDERMAIRLLEEVVIPFERLRDMFSALVVPDEE